MLINLSKSARVLALVALTASVTAQASTQSLALATPVRSENDAVSIVRIKEQSNGLFTVEVRQLGARVDYASPRAFQFHRVLKDLPCTTQGSQTVCGVDGYPIQKVSPFAHQDSTITYTIDLVLDANAGVALYTETASDAAMPVVAREIRGLRPEIDRFPN